MSQLYPRCKPQAKANLKPLYILLTVFLAIAAVAQTSTTPDAPPQTSGPQNAPLNPALPTLFIVGDSTARNQADLGWGDHFAHYFETSKINIANRARAGRSSRSYYNEGLWANVLAEMKPGDFVLIQMGHNDGGGDPATDAKARSSVKGIGDETVHSYGCYLRKYINDTHAKKATPILLTPTIRNIWANDADGNLHIERDMGYRDYEFQIAASENVPVIDMATVEADRLEALGPEQTAALFPIDHTHTSPEGAELAAQSVVIALRNANSPLVSYLKPEPPTS